MIYTEGFSEEFDTYINAAFDAFCTHFGLTGMVEAEVSAFSEEEIAELNSETRGVSSATDVLSYPTNDTIVLPLELRNYLSDISPETGKLMLGSIALCMPVVLRHAEEYENTVQREVTYMVVHALLHLIGYDHMTDKDKAVMRPLEEAVVAEAYKLIG